MALEALKVKIIALSFFSMPQTCPLPSTCPATMWPPKRPLAAIARSKLTGSPTCRRPKLVCFIVSGMTSAVKLCSLMDVAVRQTPLTETESPITRSEKMRLPPMVRAMDLGPFRIPLMNPISSMIPVNIGALPSFPLCDDFYIIVDDNYRFKSQLRCIL